MTHLPVGRITFNPQPPRMLKGADMVMRERKRCGGCGKRRLTTETEGGPRCNDCLGVR